MHCTHPVVIRKFFESVWKSDLRSPLVGIKGCRGHVTAGIVSTKNKLFVFEHIVSCRTEWSVVGSSAAGRSAPGQAEFVSQQAASGGREQAVGGGGACAAFGGAAAGRESSWEAKKKAVQTCRTPTSPQHPRRPPLFNILGKG